MRLLLFLKKPDQYLTEIDSFNHDFPFFLNSDNKYNYTIEYYKVKYSTASHISNMIKILNKEIRMSDFEAETNFIIANGHFIKLDNFNKEVFLIPDTIISNPHTQLSLTNDRSFLKLGSKLIPNILTKMNLKSVALLEELSNSLSGAGDVFVGLKQGLAYIKYVAQENGA